MREKREKEAQEKEEKERKEREDRERKEKEETENSEKVNTSTSPVVTTPAVPKSVLHTASGAADIEETMLPMPGALLNSTLPNDTDSGTVREDVQTGDENVGFDDSWEVTDIHSLQQASTE